MALKNTEHSGTPGWSCWLSISGLWDQARCRALCSVWRQLEFLSPFPFAPLPALSLSQIIFKKKNTEHLVR